MDIRNIQKTGDMFYVYLPTRWCKKYKIHGKSKVAIQLANDGSLSIQPHIVEKKPISLSFNIQEDNPDTIHKLIVACYINPLNSFNITVGKDVDLNKILNQRDLFALEMVELSGNKISCESTIRVSDPVSLLRTMSKKILNLINIMSHNPEKDIIQRYEEE